MFITATQLAPLLPQPSKSRHQSQSRQTHPAAASRCGLHYVGGWGGGDSGDREKKPGGGGVREEEEERERGREKGEGMRIKSFTVRVEENEHPCSQGHCRQTSAIRPVVLRSFLAPRSSRFCLIKLLTNDPTRRCRSCYIHRRRTDPLQRHSTPVAPTGPPPHSGCFPWPADRGT